MDKSNEELASAFIVGTCQVIQNSSLAQSDDMHNLLASNNPIPTEYAFMCGSNAEFYIRPLITCIDDTDFLIAHTHEIAISGGFPLFPSDLSVVVDKINYLKIEPYDKYPGFVQLRICGEMNYNWIRKSYEFIHTPYTDTYAVIDLDSMPDMHSLKPVNGMPLENNISGPAVKLRNQLNVSADNFRGFDFVRSVWCPHWPREAQGWLNRPRKNGWPTTDIISEVVEYGCHLVYIQHRSCRNEKKQWRFSFSLAEVILLQSWTQTQQIVYHLLRFFAKRVLMEKDCPKEDEVLCTYHLKTLMLWTCEKMSTDWWNSSSVIAICCELLKMLSEWLKKRHCSNYFIPEANLFHDPSSSEIIAEAERRVNEFSNCEILCRWFVNNYILPFIRKHKPIEEMPHFMAYVLPFCEFWKANELESLEIYFYTTFNYSYKCYRYVIKNGLNSGLRQVFSRGSKLRSYDLRAHPKQINVPTVQNVLCFTYYNRQLCILHTVYGL